MRLLLHKRLRKLRSSLLVVETVSSMMSRLTAKRPNLSFCAWACFIITSLGNLGCKKNLRFPPEEGYLARTSQSCEEDQALWTDISLPLGITLYQSKATDKAGQHVIDYYSSFPPLIIQDFYELDMERLGWRLLSKFETAARILLMFDKPQTWCIVIITPHADESSASKTIVFIDSKVA